MSIDDNIPDGPIRRVEDIHTSHHQTPAFQYLREGWDAPGDDQKPDEDG